MGGPTADFRLTGLTLLGAHPIFLAPAGWHPRGHRSYTGIEIKRTLKVQEDGNDTILARGEAADEDDFG